MTTVSTQAYRDNTYDLLAEENRENHTNAQSGRKGKDQTFAVEFLYEDEVEKKKSA